LMYFRPKFSELSGADTLPIGRLSWSLTVE
jgi:hypothetical protein